MTNQSQQNIPYVFIEWNGFNIETAVYTDINMARDFMKTRFDEIFDNVKHVEDLTYFDDNDARIVDYDGHRYMWKIVSVM